MKTENELIAEFMGWQQRPANRRMYWKDNEEKTINFFYYNTSWDWLMPVVEKIQKTGYDVEITFMASGDSFCALRSEVESGGEPDASFQQSSNNQLEAVYKTVVEFIKWFNSQTR